MNILALDRTVFYFVSSVFFCETLNHNILPAEIGIAKFSLRDGVSDSFHTFIDPGPIPLGFPAIAEYLAKKHQLPLPPNAKGISSYFNILIDILAFLKNSENSDVLILYCHPDYIKSTTMVVDKIVREAGETKSIIKVYPADQLFFQLKHITTQINNLQNPEKIESGFYNVFVAKEMLDRDCYEYTLNIGCKVR